MVPVPTIAMRCTGFGETMIVAPLVSVGRQRPRQTGARFSAKASAPSCASSVSSRLCASSAWRLNASVSLRPCVSRKTCLTFASASGALPAMRWASSCAPANAAAGCGQLADEPVLLGVDGRNRLAGEQHLEGDVVGDPLRQTDDAALPGDEAPLHLGQPEFRVLRRDDQVAGQRHLEATAERPSFDGRDERLAHHGLGEPAESTTGKDWGLPVRERLQVHARAERPAGAGEHAHRQRRIGIQLIQRGCQLDRDLAADGVLLRRGG